MGETRLVQKKRQPSWLALTFRMDYFGGVRPVGPSLLSPALASVALGVGLLSLQPILVAARKAPNKAIVSNFFTC